VRAPILVVLGSVVFGPATLAYAQTPDAAEVVEERRAMGFYRVLRAGDASRAVRYFQENFAQATWERRTPEEWDRLAQRLMQSLGEMELEGVDIMRPHTLTLALAPTNDAAPAARLEFEFEEESPHRITGLGVERGGPAGDRAGLPPFDLSAGAARIEIREALQRYFDDLARDDRFSGTALVAYEGDILFSAAHGLASKRFDVQNRLDTRFDLGSINKAFTKVAVGQLLEEGKLSLSDKLINHLADYPNRRAAEQITIAQLLDHTSGLGDMFTERFFRSSRALYRSPRDYFPIFVDEPLLFEPGTGRQYSNAGYIVLGAVIEAIAGVPYHEYIERHVFEPAGMASSGFFPHDGLEPNVAEGYTRMTRDGPGEELRSNVFRLPIVGNPAGSAQSTVEDLWRFDTALREHALLSPAYTRWMLEGELHMPGSPEASDSSRVMGAIGIAGGGPGVSAVLESDGALVVIVLSNYDPPTAEGVGQQLFRALRTALSSD
jgi:CubicO group peptidase (beta-lactamase class C family)